jgi:hypothetical protein
MKNDYIFCGFGLLTLAVDELLESKVGIGKNILILDEKPFNKNEKTLCFCEHGERKWDFALAKHGQRRYLKIIPLPEIA